MEAREDILRQLNHWLYASQRLRKFEEIASVEAWTRIEAYTGQSLREVLSRSVDTLCHQGEKYRKELLAQASPDLSTFRARVRLLRDRYFKTETLLDFYGDAINSRASEYTAALLTGCDVLARMSMHPILQTLGQKSPPVLTYIDKGLGASILKAGLRLWDQQTISPVAAIKVVRHNIFRPTSLIHEAGHQVAHMIGWNEQLADHLKQVLLPHGKSVAYTWSGWASEIAADAFAFVHVGYASIAALHDVLSGNRAFVFHFGPGEPHPISYLRVLLGIQMCRLSYGKGPWDQLETNWRQAYPVRHLGEELSSLINKSVKLLPQLAQSILTDRLACFKNQSLAQLIDPRQSTFSLLQKKYQTWNYDPARISVLEHALPALGYFGYQIATDNPGGSRHIQDQESYMLQLGNQILKNQKITIA